MLNFIRKNWLNAKSLDKTFSFPGIDDHSFIYNSSFNTLDKLYTLEPGLTIQKPSCKKTTSHTECKKCKDILGSVGKPLQLIVDEKSPKYFDFINRGGLAFPSNFLLIVTQFTYLIFNVCISTLETDFLQLSNQMLTYFGVVERFITGHEDCTDIHRIYDSCEQLS